MIPASGFLIALPIGISLGLLGSGGSILTVPVLVHLFRLNPVTGTACVEIPRDIVLPDSPEVYLDIRRPAERETEFIPGTLHIPLNRLLDRIPDLPSGKHPLVNHGASGCRSAIAVGLLRRRGLQAVRDVSGGIRRYWEEGYPVVRHQTAQEVNYV
jgi:rhodanese-related sulfurtransferase